MILMVIAHSVVNVYFRLLCRTDVWALGCCLYQLAYLQNCFEEGSNLAILSRKYTIPEDNPYGDGLVELLDRMLTVDSKARADMTEVILCLSAVYSNRPLPPRKKSSKSKEKREDEGGVREETKKESTERVGTFRTDGQGVQETIYDPTKVTEAKKLPSNSVAARRKRAAAAAKPPTAPTSTAAPAPPPPVVAGTTTEPIDFTSFHSRFSEKSGDHVEELDPNLAFSNENPFGEIKGRFIFVHVSLNLSMTHKMLRCIFKDFEVSADVAANDFFGSFDEAPKSEKGADAFAAAFDATAWGDTNMAAETAAPEVDPDVAEPESLPISVPPVPGSSNHESDEVGLEPAGTDDDARKKESPDSQRKERSRRRREGPSTSKPRTSRPQVGDPPSMEALNLSEREGLDGNASGDNGDGKDRKSAERDRTTGRPRRKEDEDKDRARRRSGSRSRRKPSTRAPASRESGSRPEKADPEGSDKKKEPNRTTSFRQKLFGAGKQQPPDP